MNKVTTKYVSISQRLTLSLALATTIATILVAAGVYFYVSTKQEQDFFNRVDKILNHYQGTVSRLVWNMDRDTISGMALTAMQDDLVTSVTIRDDKKNIFAQTQGKIDEYTLIKKRPISFEGEIIGELEMHFSSSHLSQILNNILWISLSVWFITLLIIISVTNILIRRYFRGPIHSFSKLANFYRLHLSSPKKDTIQYREFKPIEEVMRKLANDVISKLNELNKYKNHLEELVSERTAILTSALEGAQAGTFVLDVLNDHLTWDKRSCDLFHVDPEKFGGNYDAWAVLVHPDDIDEANKKVIDAMNDPSVDRISIVYRTHPKRGELRFIRISTLIERNDEGQTTFLYGLHFDITEEMKRESNLQQAKQKAEAANQAKSIFLANMSHELRTPLNAVLGFSQVLSNDKSMDKEQKKSLDIINRSGKHLLQLINDILDMSKIESGKAGLELENIDLSELVQDVVDMIRVRAESKDLQLILDLSFDFPQFVYADAPKIRQILINLLSNGVKFTKVGGVTLRLKTTSEDPNKIVLHGEVEDTGVGIKQENLDKIFFPFEQLAEAVEQKGTGLGLAITRQYVELMDGEISATSIVGKGTIFSFSIVIEEARGEVIEKVTNKEVKNVIALEEGQQEWRILIAEDQEENYILLKQLLESVGFKVQVALNGEEAVAIFKEWEPHLIWMDRRMPKMDGLAATRMIRQLENGKDVKIVALTASVFQQQKIEMLKSGMDEFIKKPYKPEEIYESMQRLLGVKYIYEDIEQEITHTLGLDELKNALLKLDNKTIEKLKIAVDELDDEALKFIGEDLKNTNNNLAQDLISKAENFDFKLLITLLENK